MEIVKKYFPHLSHRQFDKLQQLWPLYKYWNQKINLISRKDIDHFYTRHVLHSMAILKVIDFNPGASVLDVGTGGGFPGIPLAICSPETQFLLVDSVGKKIRVVEEVINELALGNIRALRSRAEEVEGHFDFITSRAVKSLPVFYRWVADKISADHGHSLANGILYLKGGNFDSELRELDGPHRVFDLSAFFSESFFETKKLVHIYKKYR